jgi:hypothetical protein
MVRPLRAGNSCAIHRTVETPVQACPQVLHRNADGRLVRPRELWMSRRLVLLLVGLAGVDRAVEVVVRQLACDILA